jgi:hypothetical protein
MIRTALLQRATADTRCRVVCAVLQSARLHLTAQAALSLPATPGTRCLMVSAALSVRSTVAWLQRVAIFALSGTQV